MYSFYVSDPEDIDFNRIVKENVEEGVMAFIITFGGPKGKSHYAIVGINNDFLSLFQYGDEVSVAGENLSSYWGTNSLELKLAEGRIVPLWTCKTPIQGARFRIINVSAIGRVKAEIEAAKNYKRRIKVKVHQIRGEA